MQKMKPLHWVLLAVAASFLFLWVFHPVLNRPFGGSGGDEYELSVDEKIEISYEAGYELGYEEGFEDGCSEHTGYYDPYDYFGRKDIVCEIAPELEQDAVHYVREESEWHPEEAMMIVEAYESQEPFWEDGSPPSLDDYQNAVHSLYRFYEYFYNAEYRD